MQMSIEKRKRKSIQSSQKYIECDWCSVLIQNRISKELNNYILEKGI